MPFLFLLCRVDYFCPTKFPQYGGLQKPVSHRNLRKQALIIFLPGRFLSQCCLPLKKSLEGRGFVGRGCSRQIYLEVVYSTAKDLALALVETVRHASCPHQIYIFTQCCSSHSLVHTGSALVSGHTQQLPLLQWLLLTVLLYCYSTFIELQHCARHQRQSPVNCYKMLYKVSARNHTNPTGE